MVSKSRRHHLGGLFHLPTTGAKVSRRSQTCSSSYGNDLMFMCTCTFKRTVSHEPVTKPKPNNVFLQKEIPHLSVDEVTSCPYSDLTRACPPPPPLGSEAEGGGRKPRRRRSRGPRPLRVGPMVVVAEEEGCSRRAAAGGHAASLCMHLQCNGEEKDCSLIYS